MKKVGEETLIDKIKMVTGGYSCNVIKGIGDDCAVVKAGNKYLLYTTDSIVEGVHFSRKTFSPRDIGRKVAAVNISDIAAMGGIPKYMLVSLFLPKEITEKLIGELYGGINEECRRYGVKTIGGNISHANQLIIDVFLIGETDKNNIIYRSGAKIGDKVLVTGTVGKKDAWTRVPEPRVKEGRLITRSKKATAMIDVSDGLSTDLLHICDESKVGVRLYADRLPTDDIGRALNGGEDYELCFTASVPKIKDVKATVIGEIIPQAAGRWLIEKNGRKSKLIAKGWDHFAYE